MLESTFGDARVFTFGVRNVRVRPTRSGAGESRMDARERAKVEEEVKRDRRKLSM
jgi:hypothetical protein